MTSTTQTSSLSAWDAPESSSASASNGRVKDQMKTLQSPFIPPWFPVLQPHGYYSQRICPGYHAAPRGC
ncbi:hypothetical protein BCR33DRAFT_718490 [Rhizoclosmatium globosum]|uniref:Uncharacterized protein n=1 Tax=Rhizoclosmatium globosum TaxID=329046 RepID=A0A1Y2C5P5_9FUNG|nr:hypothetical protein BCR33DRAFT_718490 [Rhizoclosmatium globosum]|eukprot:ORY42351.1 hypothetical protein BCR33DRAFT_718490 [Rhizoclosmatium globosum]